MLHIILLVLKILGFLVLGILALLLILICLVLLAPLVYRLKCSGENSLDSLDLDLQFHWFFHLIGGTVRYRHEELFWRFRIGWKQFGSDIEEPDRKKPERKQQKRKSRQAEETGVKNSKIQEPGRNAPDNGTDSIRPALETAENTGGRRQTDMEKKQEQRAKDDARKAKEQTPADRITKTVEKIKYTFNGICDKIRILADRKETVENFICDQTHKKAFLKGKKELIRLIRFLCPSRAEINLEFGFSDPALTGYLLAGLSLLYPLLGEYMDIRPDFDNRVLKGSLLLCGKLRAVYAVITACSLVTDKNVRNTYRHIRAFKF